MRTRTVLLATTVALTLAACTPTFRNHGYIPAEDDLQNWPSASTHVRRSRISSGRPQPGACWKAGGVLERGNYFYVRSKVRTFGPRKPQVVERQVLAISFDGEGVLQNIERFGLEDGRAVSLSHRVTESGVTDTSFLRQLLGNIGRIGPDFGGG